MGRTASIPESTSSPSSIVGSADTNSPVATVTTLAIPGATSPILPGKSSGESAVLLSSPRSLAGGWQDGCTTADPSSRSSERKRGLQSLQEDCRSEKRRRTSVKSNRGPREVCVPRRRHSCDRRFKRTMSSRRVISIEIQG